VGAEVESLLAEFIGPGGEEPVFFAGGREIE